MVDAVMQIDDLLGTICQRLDTKSLLSLSRVCRNLYRFLDDASMWEARLHSEYPLVMSSTSSNHSALDLKRVTVACDRYAKMRPVAMQRALDNTFWSADGDEHGVAFTDDSEVFVFKHDTRTLTMLLRRTMPCHLVRLRGERVALLEAFYYHDGGFHLMDRNTLQTVFKYPDARRLQMRDMCLLPDLAAVAIGDALQGIDLRTGGTAFMFTNCGFATQRVDCAPPYVAVSGRDAFSIYDVRSAERKQTPVSTYKQLIDRNALSVLFAPDASAGPRSTSQTTDCPPLMVLAPSASTLYRYTPTSDTLQFFYAAPPSCSAVCLSRHGHTLLLGGTTEGVLVDTSVGVPLATLKWARSSYFRCWCFAGADCVVAADTTAFLLSNAG